MEPVCLNLGCGQKLISGFVNIDTEPSAQLRHDVRRGLPFERDSVEVVYSEHFIEHLTQSEGIALLRECRRVLRPGGVLRLATPDLDEIVRRYGTEQWLGSGMKSHGYEWVQNRCEMFNLNMREWGHQWLYNEEELCRLGRLAGFLVRGRQPINQSEHPALSGRETRPESLLILELLKPTRVIKNDPLVSVVVPAYGPRYFAEALASACAQDYPNLEIVVCDDDSTGAIEKVTRDRAASDARIRYHRNEPREGPRQNYLKCLALARGEYIKFLNDDDLLAPSCVRRMAQCLDRYPDVTLVTSHRQCIDEVGSDLPDIEPTMRPVRADSLIDGISLAHFVIARGMNVIGEPTTTMFRRSDVIDLQPDFLCFAGMPLKGIGDVAAWLNLLSMGDAIYLVESLSRFRLHPGQWQRQPGVAENGRASWENLRHQGVRFGMHHPAEPARLLAQPLESANPTAAELYATVDACLAMGDAARAHAVLVRVLVLDPCHGRAHNDLAVLYFQSGELESARMHFQKAAALNGDDPLVLGNLAAFYEGSGEIADALTTYRALSSLAPADAQVKARVLALSARLSSAAEGSPSDSECSP